MQHSGVRAIGRQRRAGLAPVELTLSLPILLFVMALMVIIGTTAAWKARAVSVAREAVWRTNLRRTGANDPHPRTWPNDARMTVANSSRAILPNDPYSQHVVVRGPILTAPTGEALPVRNDLSDMDGGLRRGIAGIERPYPMLRRLGRIDLERDHALLQDQWTYLEMGYPNNWMRRVLRIYPIDLAALMPTETQRYMTAALAILQNPNLPILQMLDNDDELRQPTPGGLQYEPPYGIGFAPDYHFPERNPLRARLLNPDLVCSFNISDLKDSLTDPLFQEIRGHSGMRSDLSQCGVAGRLTRDYLRMYQQHMRHIDSLLHRLGMPAFPGDRPPPVTQPLPPQIQAYLMSKVGEMRANRETLERYVGELERFRDYLLALNES